MAAAKLRLPGVRILINNTKVRVQEIRRKPGTKGPIRTLPNRVLYILKGGKERKHYKNGKTKVQIFKSGAVLWQRKETLAVENIGKTEIRIIVVSLK